jgi:hypothetical protein
VRYDKSVKWYRRLIDFIVLSLIFPIAPAIIFNTIDKE